MVSCSREDLKLCGERLRSGLLVAFPTETVYGLGANALNSTAIRRIFDAKERPLSDPLIVHVREADEAFRLWEATLQDAEAGANNDTRRREVERKILGTLCGRFWPGPLTLAAKADASKVPGCVMANTGYVACRSPSHPVSRLLLEAAEVPLAAPSANKFGHVSPTTARHVWDDLMYEDVWIVNSNDSSNDNGNAKTVGVNSRVACCQVGVESTVAKLEMSDDSDEDGGLLATLSVLRQGAVSAGELVECLAGEGLGSDVVRVQRVHRATADHVPHVAPGQTIRHYSPRIASFLVSPRCYEQQQREQSDNGNNNDKLANAVVIDYGRRLLGWKDSAKAYRDLSSASDSNEAAQSIFGTLRWAEQVPEARRILFPQIQQQRVNGVSVSKEGTSSKVSDALLLAIQDRLTRAASGVVIDSLDES